MVPVLIYFIWLFFTLALHQGIKMEEILKECNEQKKLGVLYCKRQFKIFSKMFVKFKSSSTCLIGILLAIALLTQVVIYEVGLIPSQYYIVLGEKDKDGFRSLTIYAMEMIILNAIMKSTMTYLSKILYLIWRRNLCLYFHKNYFSEINFYTLNVIDTKYDNMDQRFTRDVDKQCYEWSLLISKLIIVPFTMIYYSYKCFVSTTYWGPVIIYIYFICGTIINRFLMVPVVKETIKQEKCEGEFRFQHLQVRVNAESIGFYNSGYTEKYKTNKRLYKLLSTQKSLFGWSYWLNTSVNIFDYTGGILSYLIIAIPVFAGDYDDLTSEELSAEISKNAFVCIYLVYTFSQLFDMMRVISDIAGHTHRLGELIEEFNLKNNMTQIPNTESWQQHDTTRDKSDKTGDPEDPSNQIVLKNVDIFTPNHQLLIEDISLNIKKGCNILITGETGFGKTSLLRVMRGLWKPTAGLVKSNSDILFFPQKALFMSGTLMQQIVYPTLNGYPEYSLSSDEEKIKSLMLELNMEKLTEKLGGLNDRFEKSWSDKLSPGEMQRLTFARLIYHSPKIAVMDEPTSALDLKTETELFKACKAKNITLVTVGHKESLRKFHEVELKLIGNGTWHLSPIPQ